ncbi:MAG: O-antigen ligase family protein [Burkholderiales bacterium]|nr:O-antigen ligase family protein [Burkholderiales bacterium]
MTPQLRAGTLHVRIGAREIAAILAAALPITVLTWERSAGLVGLAWLIFCITQWRILVAEDSPARAALRNSASGGFIAFAAIVAVLSLLHGIPSRAFDNPSRFALVLPMLATIACLRPSCRAWLTGVSAAGVYVGVLALVQSLALDFEAASGFTNQNKFGFISATFALLGIAGMRLPANVRPPLALLVGGVVGALIAMLLSATRGAWVAFLVPLLSWLLFARVITPRHKAIAIGSVLAIAAALTLTSGTIVHSRLSAMIADLGSYIPGVVESSVDTRVELWRGSVMMFEAHPLIGIGPGRYREANRQLIAEGHLSERIAEHGHPHNEYLAWLASGGVIGFAGLLAVLLGPLAYFIRCACGGGGTAPELVRGLGLGGALFVAATMIFAFTDAYFYIHYATVYYALTVAMLVGFIEAEKARR